MQTVGHETPVDALAAPSPSGAGPGSAAAASILLMEDEALLRSVLARALASDGYRVIEASNGREGLERYREASPDLVIADIWMPEIDGLEATAQLTEEFPDVKVIAITGENGERDYLKVAKFLGARRTLKKPFEMSELLSTVRHILDATDAAQGQPPQPSPRKFPRYSLRCPIKFAGDELRGLGRLLNISLAGCGVESAVDVRRGAYLQLEIFPPGQDEGLVIELARVAWSTGHEFGLEFIRIPERSQLLLRQIMKILEDDPTAYPRG